MINWIWFIILASGIITFMIKKDAGGLLKAMTDSAQSSIELLIALCGIMAVWSGIMKLCEKSGIIDIIAKILSPLMRIIFPGLEKKNKKAVGNIIMNIATNMMGLNNAATPFGIKAMKELQNINTDKKRASNYMITFIIINGACIQIIPTTVISIRAGLNAKNPSDIIVPTILTTLIALISGLILNALFQSFDE
ncbi:spore maturation protein [Caloramator sp. E03]|uniref:nucleoside recognition domain-containing protein n=1 Tax=Caloramator sp. E03 TaxID=2576307 RepID=UPI001110D2C0|nr:nucleoside recognition domain-containing protein [Caloramator sp. E03]QCX33465.1 spore maturation protein [Caloramator sp. E03]